MRALIFDPSAPAGLRLGDTHDPVPGPSQALVRVGAISSTSPTWPSCATAKPRAPYLDSTRLAWSSPRPLTGRAPAGARVVTFGWSGGWAELRAVETTEVAVVPEGVDTGLAAAVPVAGVTALRALRRLGSLMGGGCSSPAHRAASGGSPCSSGESRRSRRASAGSPQRGEGLAALGAAEVVTGLDGVTQRCTRHWTPWAAAPSVRPTHCSRQADACRAWEWRP